MEKSELLDRVGAEGDDRLTLSRILDRYRKARNGVPSTSDFLSPREQALTLQLLRLARVPEESYVFYGGVADAERQIVLFLPDWMSEYPPEETPIRALRAEWRSGDALSHRDLLGSLMGLGIVREKIGDIYVTEAAADVLILDSVREFLLQNWESAGRAKVSVREIAPDEIRVPARKVQEIRDTVSSVRLDSVIASGFRMSRGKASELVNAGRVQVNWTDCQKPDRVLQVGDTIAARGFGRLSVAEIGGLTRKGRIAVTLHRYV